MNKTMGRALKPRPQFKEGSMKRLFTILVIILLLMENYALATVGVNDIDGYVGEATNIYFKGQNVSTDGSKVTVLANGHKEGVTTNVSTESNLTSAALAYGVICIEHSTQRYVSLADGTAGQMLTIIMTSIGTGDLPYTITDDYLADSGVRKTGWDDIAFDAAGDQVTLWYVDDTTGWVVIGGYGVTITQ